VKEWLRDESLSVMQAGIPGDLDWPDLIESAIGGAGVRAVYQPIVDVARGRVVGYEALTRFEGYPVSDPERWLR
jgi:hypothetical protein